MARDRNPADIVPGSTWITPDEASSALVISITAGYVTFEDAEDGAVRTLHCLRFREQYVAPYDAQQLRSQFSMTLSNLRSFHAFYSVSTGKLYARSDTIPIEECYKAARGRPPLPTDAKHIDTYSVGKSVPGEPLDVIAPPRWHRNGRLRCIQFFFDDLHGFLRRLRRSAAI